MVIPLQFILYIPVEPDMNLICLCSQFYAQSINLITVLSDLYSNQVKKQTWW